MYAKGNLSEEWSKSVSLYAQSTGNVAVKEKEQLGYKVCNCIFHSENIFKRHNILAAKLGHRFTENPSAIVTIGK